MYDLESSTHSSDIGGTGSVGARKERRDNEQPRSGVNSCDFAAEVRVARDFSLRGTLQEHSQVRRDLVTDENDEEL